MDFKYKQLEQELTALSRVFSELGARLQEVAKEVTAPGTMPSEKLLEQISASRTSFENARSAVHGHAGAMLVSPLPKLGELVSIATIDSLLKATAVAEQTKFAIEGEREKALAILGRVLSITHRESGDFKPLQECHGKIGELRSAVSNVLWPHRHPESESIVASKHPTTALLHFVENLDKLDDDSWMMLETTITDSYGKPLFVAASRGKLEVRVEAKIETKPVAAAPAPAKAPAPEPSKPVVAAEKPADKKPVAEKAPETPVAAPEKKTVTPVATAPVAPAAPAVAAVAEKVQPKPIVAAPPVVAPAAPAPVASASAQTPEKKPVVAPAAPPAAVAPVAPAAVVAVPATPPAPPAPVVAPAPVAAAAPPRPPAPVAAPAPPAPTIVAQVPVVLPPTPAAPPAAAANTPAPAAVASNGTPAAASPLNVTMNSLTALATATEPTEKKPAAAPSEAADKQRKEPRLAAPAPQVVSKPEPPKLQQELPETAQQGVAGDGSQRPQRWGFWRGNR